MGSNPNFFFQALFLQLLLSFAFLCLRCIHDCNDLLYMYISFFILQFQYMIFIIIITVNSPLMDTLVSRQLYLRTPFQIPVLPPSQTLYLHIPVSPHSRKGTRTLLKMKIGLFFCLRSLVSGHPCIITDSWQ